jgi:predicted phosphodiesterase
LYSFGLLSDVHVNLWTGDNNATTFENALSYFDGQDCDFVCISGDLTNTGFYMYDGINHDDYWYDETQFAEYKRICDLHPHMPVYECCGNHEGYLVPITEDLTKLEEFTGNGLIHIKTQGNDVFIFVGQSEENIPMSREHFEWLGNTLEANKNKRCFVFIHPYVDASDSGNPKGLHRTPLFNYTTVDKHGYDKSTFASLMANYPNAILFHGHSHMQLENQKIVRNANYSTALGFKSIHVPSTAYCREIVETITEVDGEIIKTYSMENREATAQGYIVDVYENHIVLKGYDFTESAKVPIAQYCIDTTLQTIEANTFTDSTGTITISLSGRGKRHYLSRNGHALS